jgi:hypothetical protein
VARFGHLGLARGSWNHISSSQLRRHEWPVPRFVRRDLLTGKTSTIIYGDDPAEEISTEPSSAGDADRLPRDGLLGHGAVEIVLTKILSE